ncbi:MAG: hypothetical protein AB7Q17_04210 [Phycisphaerae bacterium]
MTPLIRARGRAAGAVFLAALLHGVGGTAVAGPACLLELFFSAEDPFAGTGRVAPVLPANLAAEPGSALNSPTPTNPAIERGRLWMWATGIQGVVDPIYWNGIGLNVVIHGPAAIVGGGMLNITSPFEYSRWETGSDLVPPSFNLIAVTRLGLRLPPPIDGFDDGVAKVLLGYLDFEPRGGTSAVRFQVGPSGISSPTCPGVYIIYVRFGVGDELVRADDFGRTSTIPDAWIGVPELGSALLLASGGLAWCLGGRRVWRAEITKHGA